MARNWIGSVRLDLPATFARLSRLRCGEWYHEQEHGPSRTFSAERIPFAALYEPVTEHQMLVKRSIDDVVDTLRRARQEGVASSLLIGSGCSVTAGIPTAEGFVRIIENEYPLQYGRALNKTYCDCMSQLSPGQRRNLIGSKVKTAKINWAHIAIAQLINAGVIDRVLTTNFDPLVVRACALLGQFPAIYDVTASENFKPGLVCDPSVFYLHGQHTGFVLINTAVEFDDNSRLLAPVFQEAVRRTTWIVIGYSGDNDPVFDHLAKINRFDYSLYWVGHRDSPPLPVVCEQLLEPDKEAFYVKGFDADDFLVTLAQKLDCFPPPFVSKPFSHLREALAQLTTYEFRGTREHLQSSLTDSDDSEANTSQTSESSTQIGAARQMVDKATSQTSESTTPTASNTLDVMGAARQMIKKAIDEIEGIDESGRDESLSEKDIAVERNALSLLMAGEYDKVADLRPEYERRPQSQLGSHIAWAYVMLATEIVEKAIHSVDQARDDSFARAGELFRAALEIKPDMREALNNYGVALYRQAEVAVEKNSLFNLAYEKLSRALEIDPYAYDSLKNWGDAISSQAETKSGSERDRLFEQCYEKYRASVAIDPKQPETFFSWGNALFQQAQNKSGDEAFQLCVLSGEKYQSALAVNPLHDKSWHNWGVVFTHQAQMREGSESDYLFDQAYSAYCEALRIKPGKYESLENWANASSKQAQRKVGRAADLLYQRAYELYTAALKANSNNPRGLDNWGTVLTQQAQTKSDDEADRLFEHAYDKFAEALKIDPKAHEAFYGWGVALLRQAVKKQGKPADELYSKCFEKLQAALRLRPEHHGAMFNFGSAAFEQALSKSGDEANNLFKIADERFEAALAIKQDMYEAAAMWALSLFEQAKRKIEQGADDLFTLADERFEQALSIKPDLTNALTNWGTALFTRAKTKTDPEEADKLYALANEKFQQAIDINPKLHDAVNNWGLALLAQAQSKSGSEAEDLYERACEKFCHVTELKPDFHLVHLNWGTARLYQAANRQGVDVENILIEAEQELLKAESVQPGHAAYNLACVHAGLGNELVCREWLERARELGKLPSRDHIERDPDFQTFRHSQWFREFLVSV